MRSISGESAVENLELFEYESPQGWQISEALLQSYLQIFQDQRHESDIGDFVSRESFSHELRAERPQMHHRCATNKRSDESDHKIDRMVRGQDTQIPHARPEREESSERGALFQV